MFWWKDSFHFLFFLPPLWIAVDARFALAGVKRIQRTWVKLKHVTASSRFDSKLSGRPELVEILDFFCARF